MPVPNMHPLTLWKSTTVSTYCYIRDTLSSFLHIHVLFTSVHLPSAQSVSLFALTSSQISGASSPYLFELFDKVGQLALWIALGLDFHNLLFVFEKLADENMLEFTASARLLLASGTFLCRFSKLAKPQVGYVNPGLQTRPPLPLEKFGDMMKGGAPVTTPLPGPVLFVTVCAVPRSLVPSPEKHRLPWFSDQVPSLKPPPFRSTSTASGRRVTACGHERPRLSTPRRGETNGLSAGFLFAVSTSNGCFLIRYLVLEDGVGA